MKKHHFLLLILYASIIIISIVVVVLDSLELQLQNLITDFWMGERFVFSIVFLILAVTILLLLLWVILDDNSKRSTNQNLRRILNNQEVSLDEDTEINTNLSRLSKKMTHLTTSLQNTENSRIQNGQEIVEQERKRIARDLHDTVSQELFASSMILSGVSANLDQIEREQLEFQLTAVESMLQNAQKDLRILLLHLRPTELENKTLSEGFDILLKELTDKSSIEVVYKKNLGKLPKKIEDNVFRIAQEFISNTLKHAKATRLEVYLNQTETELQLKMVDNGVGFDMDERHDLSYGITNIEDRVDDMAGTITFLSQKGKGVSMDIRLPLVKGEKRRKKMTQKIRVILVDDHEMVRLGLKSFFNLQPDIEVVGEAGNGIDGIKLALELKPDVVVMDLVMPEMSGVEATLKLLKEWKEAKILVLTSYLDNEKIYPVIEAGAKGYMLKTSSAAEILNAIHKVARGDLAIETEVDKKIKAHDQKPELHEDLTARERDILKLLAKGYDNQTIADELFISLKTVKTHVSNILAKLEVDDRTQAVVYAFKHHLVPQDEE